MRSRGPNPGKNPKNVGEMERPNCGRFPWVTKSPCVNWFRMAVGPCDVAFTTLMLGWSFHEFENRDGRVNPVDQSTVVRKLRTYSTLWSGSLELPSPTKTSWRWFDAWSLTASAFDQFQLPMRIGVDRENDVDRLSKNCDSVSAPPAIPAGTSSVPELLWKVWLLL